MKQIVLCMMLLAALSVSAQQYSGIYGLIHVPSAEMDSTGDARIGAHFLNKNFLPKSPYMTVNGEPYHTFDTYLSITPFWWLEAGFVLTFEKGVPVGDELINTSKFAQKDRYFTIKLNPLREGKYYPAVAVGYQDCFSSSNSKHTGFFTNYYVALTKHLSIGKQLIGATVVYRHYDAYYNHRWNGVVGGITCRPSFARNWRAIVEWTGCDVNFGVDCLLWRHLLLQASLQDGKYPSAGVCYKVNLF